MVLGLRQTIRELREELRTLAGALTQMRAGADVDVVLQALPPSLLTDAMRRCSAGVSSAPSGDQRRLRASSGAGGVGQAYRSSGRRKVSGVVQPVHVLC